MNQHTEATCLPRPLWSPDELGLAEDRKRIRVALVALSAPERSALRYWEDGLSYAAIAERMGIPLGAIGPLLARARAALLDAFDQMDFPRPVGSWHEFDAVGSGVSVDG